jgi:hypothetical protein
MSVNSESIPTTAGKVKHLASGAAAFLLASFFLPGLSYVSIVMFGFPAILVVIGGYVGWLLLRRVNRSMADICGVAMLPGAPITVLLILLPSGLLYIILKVKSRHSATRLEMTP